LPCPLIAGDASLLTILRKGIFVKRIRVKRVKILPSAKREIAWSIKMNQAEIERFDELAFSVRKNKADYFRALLEDRLPPVVPILNLKDNHDLARASTNLHICAREINFKNAPEIAAIEKAITEFRLALIGAKS
jgi:hypothetical protein